MSTTDFSRTFLREGYDMSEVRAFLADVERTIRGQASEPDQIVTARKAEEIEFSVKFRGFNMDQVDAEIDRLIGVLRELDRQREWAAERAAASEASAAAPDDKAETSEAASVSEAPVTASSVSEAPVTASSVSEAPVTAASVSEAPVTAASVSEAPSQGIAAEQPGAVVPEPDHGETPDAEADCLMPPVQVPQVPAQPASALAPLLPGSESDPATEQWADDVPTATVVDRVAASFGTQEAVDEILRSMTQSKEQ